MQTNSALLEGEPSSWRSAVLKHRKGPRVQGSKDPRVQFPLLEGASIAGSHLDGRVRQHSSLLQSVDWL